MRGGQPITIDHGRYVTERRYRREIRAAFRRRMRVYGLYRLNFVHAPDGRCCRLESEEATCERLTEQLREDGVGVEALDGPHDFLPGAEPAVMSKFRGLGAAVTRAAARLAMGAVTPCEHLRRNANQPMLMWAYDPSRLLCFKCYTTAAIELRKTPESLTCDSCRRQSDRVMTSVVEIGQVRVIGGICPTCTERELVREVQYAPEEAS